MNKYLLFTVLLISLVLGPSLAVAQTSAFTATITNPANNATLRVGEPVDFTATASGGNPPYAFLWDFGDGSGGGGSPFVKTYQAPGQRTVKLKAVDFSGQRVERTIQVNVLSPGGQTLTATITNPANNASIRIGDSTDFTATASGGNPPYAFLWDFGDGTGGGGNPFAKIYQAPGNRSVKLTVTDFDARRAEKTIQVNVVNQGGSQAPVISNLRVTDITQTGATVRWETNIPADSRVIYDTVSHPQIGSEAPPNFGYAFSTPTSDSDPKVTAHAVEIGGLSANTTYYFRALSRS